jgi:hypothetical protein
MRQHVRPRDGQHGAAFRADALRVLLSEFIDAAHEGV